MNLKDLFLEKFIKSGGEFFESLEDFFEKFNNVKKISVERGLKRKLKTYIENYSLNEVAVHEAEVSFTTADAAIAETGSIIFAFKDTKKHLLTALPKIHVVFLKENKIYRSLEEALEDFLDAPYISIVTGPSKTGDIELIHVTGVHGPEHFVLIFR